MTWTTLITGRSHEIYHLNGDDSFSIKDGKIIFSSGHIFSFAEKDQGGENSHIVYSETQRFVKAIKKAKRKNRLLKIAKWCAVGSFLIISLFVINGALVSQGAPQPPGTNNSALMPSPTSLNGDAMPATPFQKNPQEPAVQETPRKAETVTSNQPQIQAEDLVSGINKGVGRGDVTIGLGPEDAANTLYVFSDPLCPYCQKFEPTLHKLAKQGVRIEVFPVSVIGGEKSLPLASSALCEATPEERAAVWKTAASGDPVMDAVACNSGTQAVNTNNKFFRAAQFIGTPTILNAEGQEPPSSVSRNAESITSWLNS